jgi:hypothetical protein
MARRLALVTLVALVTFVATLVLTGRMRTGRRIAGRAAARRRRDAVQGRAPAGLPDLTASPSAPSRR